MPCESCPICYEDIDVSTTGLMQMTCKHSYHFKCISTWFSKGNSSCPMCRKDAGELELLNPVLTRLEEDEQTTLGLTRRDLDVLLKSHGGVGVTNTMHFFNGEGPNGITGLTRGDLDLLCAGNGANLISNMEWERRLEEFEEYGFNHLATVENRDLMVVYDALRQEHPDEQYLVDMFRDVWEISADNEEGRSTLEEAKKLLYECKEQCEGEESNNYSKILVTVERIIASRAPMTLSRQQIEDILQHQGSSASSDAFFTHSSHEEALSYIVTSLENINQRLIALGAPGLDPSYFQIHATSSITEQPFPSAPKNILNPEEDNEMGPHL